MRITLGALGALVLAGATYIQPAFAQPAPQGSYLNSCTHIGMEGNRLFADCRRMDGAWQRTVLDIDRCAGDIANLNGRLSCSRAREGYGSSFRDSWRDEWRGERRERCSAYIDPYDRERCWRGW
jgi:CVNH domain